MSRWIVGGESCGTSFRWGTDIVPPGHVQFNALLPGLSAEQGGGQGSQLPTTSWDLRPIEETRTFEIAVTRLERHAVQ